MSYTRLGDMPKNFGHTAETPSLWLESAPGSGVIKASPLTLEECEIAWGANDRIPRATLKIGLGASPADIAAAGTILRDWLLLDINDNAKMPLQLVGGRRRVQVRTVRPLPAEDWCVFDGYVDEIPLGWSGSRTSNARWLTVKCTSAIAAADRELNQFLIGQYRRTRDAEDALLHGGSAPAIHQTLCATGLPLVFNPGGHGNCDSTPLSLGGGKRVYVFCDPKHKRSVKWNVARMLRYLQWAALQPGPTPPPASERVNPYHVTMKGTLTGFSSAHWTSLDLWFSKAQGFNTLEGSDAGPNLDALVEPHQAATATLDDGPPRSVAMRQQLAGLAVHGFSVLEAFAFVCDKAGIAMEPRVALDYNGRAMHYLRFTVRGDWRDDEGALPDQTGDVDIGDSEPPKHEKGTSRLVNLYVASDRSTPPAAEESALRNSAHGAGGQLALREARLRATALALGEAAQFEMTPAAQITAWPIGQTSYSLLPGWEIDDWWDINPADDDAINTAKGRIGNTEWLQRYGKLATSFQRRNTGRLWVLNEDGRFRGSTFERQQGPFQGTNLWRPYRFATVGLVKDLTTPPPGGGARGDMGWSARRRRFLPTIAQLKETAALGDDLSKIQPIVDLSFDGGLDFKSCEKCNATPKFDTERGAVRFTNANPEEIVHPSTGMTLPEAYMRGLLRVQVHCNIESDDAVWGWSKELAAPPAGANWLALLDRRGKATRRLRTYPSVGGAAARNALISSYGQYVTGANESDQEALNTLAQAARDETLSPYWSGQVSMPWWQRDYRWGRLKGYRVGDEVRALYTQDSNTYLDLGAGRLLYAGGRLTRIVGVAYRYTSPAGFVTTLQLENDAQPIGGRAGLEGAA